MASIVKVVDGAVDRRFRGIVLHRIPVRGRTGKFVNTNIIGFAVNFEAKDQVKEFCKERGGTWDSHERLWYVPLDGESTREILEHFWAVAQEAVKEFGDQMSMGGVWISVEIEMPQDTIEKIISWLEKQVKIASIGLELVPPVATVAKLPAQVTVLKTETEEDANGQTRYIRRIGLANGEENYLYTEPQDCFYTECKSGQDADGKNWWWIPGEKTISDGLRQDLGWQPV